MAAVVFAVPRKLYVYSSTPADVGAGGVELPGIEERDIRFDPGMITRRRRTGVGVNSGYRIRRGRVAPARLFIQLRNASAAALKILRAHLTTDGAAMRPTGGTSTAPYAKMPTFDIVVRPDAGASFRHIYSPNWVPTDETLALLVSSDDLGELDGAELVLEAARPTNATGPAYMEGTAAAINTAYGYGA